MEANKVMEAFLGGRGERGEGGESDTPTRRDHLGHEEERLLEMVGIPVRSFIATFSRLDDACLVVPVQTWLPGAQYTACAASRNEGKAF